MSGDAGPEDKFDLAGEPAGSHAETVVALWSELDAFADLQLPGYQVHRRLSAGAQGWVYLATQNAVDRQVAIKILKGGRFATATALQRFQREIKLAGRLRHPHIVTVHDSGTSADGRPFLVMDYVRGEALDAYVRRARLGVRETLTLFIQICRAVDYAHLHGIVHRDLKPSNILVDAEGQPRILDFGLAKSLQAPADLAISEAEEFVGTIPYMAPEQVRGAVADIEARTDVYALGVVLYSLLTGALPYDTDCSVPELMCRIAECEPLPPTQRWRPQLGVGTDPAANAAPATCPIDRDLTAILLTALAKDKNDRYHTANEFADDLRAYLEPAPLRARRRSRLHRWTRYGRRFAQRQPVWCGLLIVLLAAVSAHALFGYLAYEWTRLALQYERWAGAVAPSRLAALPNVRVIGMQDGFDVAGLAARVGALEVHARSPRSLRALHGHLMELLVDASPRLVVWDIHFIGPSAYDERFIAGAQALARAGIPVIAAGGDWRYRFHGEQVSPAIRRAVRLGSVLAQQSPDGPWWLSFVVQRPHEAPQPSLALLAFAGMRQPQAEFDLALPRGALEYTPTAVELRYWVPATDVPGGRRWLGQSDRIPLTRLDASKGDAGAGLDPGDLDGALVFTLPARARLDEATRRYEDVFAAAPTTRAHWFRDKIVLVADMRGNADHHVQPDGEIIPRCYSLAAGIETALASATLQRPGLVAGWSAVIAAALLGLGVALFAPPRGWGLATGIVLMALVLCLGSWTLLWFGQVVVNPLVLVGSAGFAAALSRAVRRELRTARAVDMRRTAV